MAEVNIVPPEGGIKVDPLLADYVSKTDPVVDPPTPPEPPQPPQPPEPGPDDQVVKVKDLIGENFKSVDELKLAAQRGVKIKDEDLTELEALRQGKAKFGELEAEVQTLRQMPTLETPEYFRLEHIRKNHPEDLQFYQQFVFGGLNDIDLLKRNIVRENPIIKDDPVAVQRKLERSYPNYFKAEADPDSQEYKDDQMDIKMDAARIRASIQKTFDAFPVPEIKKPEDKSALVAEVNTAWGGTDVTIDGKITMPFYVDKDYKQLKEFEVEVPIEQLKPFLQAAIAHQVQMLQKPDKTKIQEVVNTAKQLYIVKNLAFYNTKIAEFIEAKKDLEWRMRSNNPAPPPGPNPTPAASGDAGDQLARHLGLT